MTPQQIELALETIALVLEDLKKTQEKQQATITAIKGALAEHAMREVQRLGQEIEQAPVAWEQFYTTTPQRKWIGLTKQQQLDIFSQSVAKKRSEHQHYMAIEQALKEQNQ